MIKKKKIYSKKEASFIQKISEFRKLPTFIDIKSHLNKINIDNNKTLNDKL